MNKLREGTRWQCGHAGQRLATAGNAGRQRPETGQGLTEQGETLRRDLAVAEGIAGQELADLHLEV